MYHRCRRRKLGVKSKHRRALLRNLVRALVRHKRIETTLAKAKEARIFFDQMVTVAKRGDLHARRRLISEIGCAETADRMLRETAPLFKERAGGYTRVLRTTVRPGDNAQLAILEFSVPFDVPQPKKKKEKKAKKEAAAEKASAKAEKPEKAEKAKPEKEKKPSKKAEAAEKPTEAEAADQAEKKESEKRGGFLGTLRKFLKGDE